MTGAALFRVETVEPYPESYGSATEIVKDELQRGVIRPIKMITLLEFHFIIFKRIG